VRPIFDFALPEMLWRTSMKRRILRGIDIMSDVLVRIKRAVLAGHFRFSRKALDEMDADCITPADVAESILNAVAIYKTIRSTSPWRRRQKEHLYIIESPNLDGLSIYTKGKLTQEDSVDTYYFLISSKRAL
jgi:hypothetical protein